jgi:NAD(P)-dependent dehydrogenase (short-subunit alcohol dehydrogenase family)
MTKNKSAPVCLITGGSSGIGLATAKRFFNAGYQIAICGRDVDRLDMAQREILATTMSTAGECWTWVADLNDVQQAKMFGQRAIEHFGQVDVLVNNAASAPLGAFEDVLADTFETAINTNIRSVFYLTQSIWREMKRRAVADQNFGTAGSGVVVNISSMAAVDPFPGFSLYGACKSWLELLTLALAAEGGEVGLRICAVRPGAVETPLLRGLFPDYPADQCASPEKIAETVWSCVHEPLKYPSGQSFPVSA